MARVLEQSAFSDLQMDAPVSVSKLMRMMDNTDGYRVDRPELHQDNGFGGRLGHEEPGRWAFDPSVAASGR